MAIEYGNGGNLNVTMDGPFGGSGGGGSAKLATINAPLAAWKGGESPFTQVVTVEGITVSSKIDLQMSEAQILHFENAIIAFRAVNNNGIITLYSYGSKPDIDLEIQATITEVMVEGVILGNICMPMAPQADYNQADESKANYIKNKPNAAIKKAQDTADSAKTAAEKAQTTANDALPKAGGTVTGELTVQAPTANGHAATKLYVDNKHMSIQISVPASGWSASAPYTQAVSVTGLLATDNPHVFPVYSDALTTAEIQAESWAMVNTATTGSGSLTFKCFGDKPTADLTLIVEVNR